MRNPQALVKWAIGSVLVLIVVFAMAWWMGTGGSSRASATTVPGVERYDFPEGGIDVISRCGQPGYRIYEPVINSAAPTGVTVIVDPRCTK